MTSAGLDRVLDFAHGVWPRDEHTEALVHAWRVKLDRFADDQVMQAVFDLAETEQWLPALSAVYQRCVDLGNQAAINRQAEQRAELTAFGADAAQPHDRRWRRLSADDQARWLQVARDQWPAWLDVQPSSPLLVAHAAALARRAEIAKSYKETA